jgi:hypothetical protein
MNRTQLIAKVAQALFLDAQGANIPSPLPLEWRTQVRRQYIHDAEIAVATVLNAIPSDTIGVPRSLLAKLEEELDRDADYIYGPVAKELFDLSPSWAPVFAATNDSED